MNKIQSILEKKIGQKERRGVTGIEKTTAWVGSVSSLILHTIVFVGCAMLGILGLARWDTILLVVTTVVSLEAIYLAIFIQMTVNEHSRELDQVTENVEDIQEDIEEISEDVEDIQEDVEDIQEDVEEMSEEEKKEDEAKHRHSMTLDQLTRDVRRVLDDLEMLKKGK
jgi:uncharacterized protein YoxC